MEYAKLLLTTIKTHRSTILDGWVDSLQDSSRFRDNLMGKERAREHCQELLAALTNCLSKSDMLVFSDPAWDPLRAHLQEGANQLALDGFKPSEAAAVVLLMKKPVIDLLAEEHRGSATELADAVGEISNFLDQAGLWKTERFYESQQSIIRRQQQELLELSTPVVELWDGILALPLIGTIDSNRAQVVMESLLERIVETKAEVAIIDITGVPTVDTMVAQHLLKAVSATQLMGARCIISGISPTIAQTMVQLGIDLESVMTKATIAAAFEVALQTRGARIEKVRRSKQ